MPTIDEQIAQSLRDAQRSGELQSAASWGKPLDFADGYAQTPEELRMAFKALKDAGFLPPEVEATMDKRTSMGVLGDLDQFTKYQAATAITDAAQNPGGIAGAGVGIGVGAALGAQLAQSLQAGAAPAAAPAEPSRPAEPSSRDQAPTSAPNGPPPLPGSTQWYLGMDGQQVGPLAQAEIQALVTAGTATTDTLVWRVGMVTWTRLADVPELQDLGSTPPPLPS